MSSLRALYTRSKPPYPHSAAAKGKLGETLQVFGTNWGRNGISDRGASHVTELRNASGFFFPPIQI